MNQPNTNKAIGRYLIDRKILSTAASELFLCTHTELDIKVVVKLFDVKQRLLDSLPYDTNNWHNRFIQEAQLLASIDHPFVIKVTDFGYYKGQPYYVMPFVESTLLHEIGKDVEGESGVYPSEFDTLASSKKCSIARSVDLLTQIASALCVFHDKGLVHRDIKPGNILLTADDTGFVKLCDPGLAKFPNNDHSLADYWLGTRDYIAPEQYNSATDVDARADVFSLGVLGYRMLTGVLPVGVVPALSDAVDEVPQALSDLLMACMANDKNQRPSSAKQFLETIKHLHS